MTEKKMLSLAEQLKSLRDAKADIEGKLKSINGEIEKVNRELTDLMTENEMPSFTYSGSSFSLTTRTFASALNEENGGKEQLYNALKENGFDELFTVNPQTLTSFVKEQMSIFAEENDGEEGLPGWLAGKVKLYEKTSVGIRKATRK